MTLKFQVFPDGNITPGTLVANTDTNISGVPQWEYYIRNSGGEY